ncbi:MAG TPA: hypothetical protein VM841_11530 [Actinomycetota bacterium]|nr:hypothetical protein [Actinomycetota bacterium]
MSEYPKLAARLGALRAAGRHAEAAALAEAQRHLHPQEAHSIDWWIMSAAAAAGEHDTALRVLEESLDRGDWFAPDRMRETGDFDSLAGDERFEQALKRCGERRDEALHHARPALTIQRPASPPPWPVLLALHGNGEPVASVLRHWGGTGRLLAAPVSGSVSGPDRFVWAAATTGEVRRHVATLSEMGAMTSDLIIGGFDRGAYHALRLALTGAVAARGAIVVSPAMNDIEEIEGSLPDAAARGLRVAFVYGTGDPRPAKAVPRVAAQLAGAGLETRVESRDELVRDYAEDWAALLPDLLAFIAPA